MKSPEGKCLEMSSLIEINDLTNVALLARSPLRHVDLNDPEHLLVLREVTLPLDHSFQDVLVLLDGLVQEDWLGMRYSHSVNWC